MSYYTDQTGRVIFLPAAPRRIISLVPSQTELLADLGLNQEVIGITKFCVHPSEWWRTKTRVGGTKQLHPELIHQLQPDLIIANKEENVKEQVLHLAEHYPVWVSDVNTLAGALDMIGELGRICGKGKQAGSLMDEIKTGFAALPVFETLIPAAYLVWRNPYMAAGGDTFIDSMLRTAGFENSYAGRTRYPETDTAELRKKGIKVLLLSSEPYPFSQKHADELQKELPGVRIMLVDGEMFSWYGSRLRKAAGYFSELAVVNRQS